MVNFQFPILMVLKGEGDGRVLLYGAEYQTRSDGTDAFAVAQAYSSNEDFAEGTIFEEEGERYKAMQEVKEGFHFTGMVMEWLTEVSNEFE